MKIGIIGLGLIGGSYARALFPYGYEVYGVDLNEESLNYAKEQGIISEGFTDPKDILKELDVVFLCLYPSQLKDFFKKYIMCFKEGAILSDVGGIKRKVIDAYDLYRRDDIDFVAAHPIAGKEKSGVTESDASIFKDANFIITKTPFNENDSINLIQTLAKQMGFKTVTIMTDKEHDEAISYTSQLTHVLAMALINSDQDKYHTKTIIGDSFRDLTRIANMNELLWSELFLQNKDFLLRSINEFEIALNTIKDAIETKDIEELQSLMKKATIRRRSLDETKN
ncbi:MAG: prephenate dehydrogenase [Candidatus Izemoplasmataceae bacterium]